MKKKPKPDLTKRPPNEAEIKQAQKFAKKVGKLAVDLFEAKQR